MTLLEFDEEHNNDEEHIMFKKHPLIIEHKDFGPVGSDAV